MSASPTAQIALACDWSWPFAGSALLHCALLALTCLPAPNRPATPPIIDAPLAMVVLPGAPPQDAPPESPPAPVQPPPPPEHEPPSAPAKPETAAPTAPPIPAQHAPPRPKATPKPASAPATQPAAPVQDTPPLAVATAPPAATPVSGAWQDAVGAWLRDHKTYPADARRLAEQGRVIIRFTAQRDGSVATVTLLQSSGSAALDQAAQDLVRSARLPPFPASMTQDRTTISLGISYALEP